MDCQACIKRILDDDTTEDIKALQLDTLALSFVPGSPNQAQVIKASDEIKARNGGHEAIYNRFLQSLEKVEQNEI